MVEMTEEKAKWAFDRWQHFVKNGWGDKGTHSASEIVVDGIEAKGFLSGLSQERSRHEEEIRTMARRLDERGDLFNKERSRSLKLVEALEKIANYPHPKFNGEIVWTISDVSGPTNIAKEALSAHQMESNQEPGK